MTETRVSSDRREITLGFGRSFVMIGERIDPTGRRMLAAAMAVGGYSGVVACACAQVAAGAHMRDVGVPLADEPARGKGGGRRQARRRARD